MDLTDTCMKKNRGKNFQDSGKIFPLSYIYYAPIWKDLSSILQKFAPRIKEFIKANFSFDLKTKLIQTN
jgi:hypothetical protein